MRRLADAIVNLLLRLAPWYRPAEIAEREARSQAAHRRSIAARLRAEAAIGQHRVRR